MACGVGERTAGHDRWRRRGSGTARRRGRADGRYAAGVTTSPRIHWLASFPKSGNTWVRFLLYQYLYGEIKDTAELGRRIPDVHAGDMARAETGTRTLLVKVHWGFGPRMPHVERTEGIIYIVRRPKDVMLSMLNYYRLRNPQATWTDEYFVRDYIRNGGDQGSVRNGYGSWEDNLLSWLAQRRFPLLLVRYEDLKADAGRELGRMLEFLGEPVEAGRVARAVAGSTFERMREIEAREKAASHSGNVFIGGKAEAERGLMFMSKGRSGATLASIGVPLDREFDERFAAGSWLAGY